MTNALIVTGRTCRRCKNPLPALAHFNAQLCPTCKPKVKHEKRKRYEAQWSQRDGGPRNKMSREGAEDLCRQIKRYWAERGKEVDVRTVRDGYNPAVRGARYDVRSDMRNGWPR